MVPFVSRIALRYYRSVRACDVRLGSLVALVGPNGSGKSNFLDALRFVRDGLRYTLEHAIRDRGGIDAVRTRSSGHPTHFGISLQLNLEEGVEAIYEFRVEALAKGAFAVQRESCRVRRAFFPPEEIAHFTVERGELKSSHARLESAVEPDRLYLTTVSARPEFRPLYDALSNMGFYNLNPSRIRDLQDPDPGHVLSGDGGNLAAVLREVSRNDPQGKQRIEDYLKQIVPAVMSVGHSEVGPKETIEFRQDVGHSAPWKFLAQNMSDGTLRALGILLAAYHGRSNGARKVRLIGIEEPEAALHPGAAAAIAEALNKASEHVQILLTTHSPDLLDHPSFTEDRLRSVAWSHGSTVIAHVDPGSRSALQEGLYSAGELLRMKQLEPDAAEIVPKDPQAEFDFDPQVP
jgi:predicted ATPase